MFISATLAAFYFPPRIAPVCSCSGIQLWV